MRRGRLSVTTATRQLRDRILPAVADLKGPRRTTINGRRTTINGRRTTINGRRTTINGLLMSGDLDRAARTLWQRRGPCGFANR
jgi:hypothetical protein